ncbi:MAG: hypothetical protein ACO2ON_01580 [Candidatus Nanopusillus sp.]
MSLPYLYNQSLNYTVNIIVTPEGIASTSLYPLIIILLGIAPVITTIIILSLNLPYRTKIMLFFLNSFFSVIIPTAVNSLISYLQVLQYVYLAVTNDMALFNTISSFTTLAQSLSINIPILAVGMVIVNIILGIFHIFLELKEKKII